MDLPDFFYQFYTKEKRMEQLASTLFDAFKYICGLTLLNIFIKKIENWLRMSLGLVFVVMEAPSVGQDAGEVI